MEQMEQREELPNWTDFDHWFGLYEKFQRDLESCRIRGERYMLNELQHAAEDSELANLMRIIYGAHGMTLAKDDVEARIYKPTPLKSRQQFEEWWKELKPIEREKLMWDYHRGFSLTTRTSEVSDIIRKYRRGDPSLS